MFVSMARPQAVIHSGFGSLLQDAAQDGEGGLVFFQAGPIECVLGKSGEHHILLHTEVRGTPAGFLS
jgi:hypothetical protein